VQAEAGLADLVSAATLDFDDEAAKYVLMAFVALLVQLLELFSLVYLEVLDSLELSLALICLIFDVVQIILIG